MKRETFFAIMGAVGALFGLGFVLLPELSLSTYGVPTAPHNVMQSRYFGSALLAFGLVTFLARETQDAIAVRALLVSSIVGNALGAVISAMAAGSLQNGMAWMSVALYGAFVAGAAYFLFGARQAAQPQAT